MSVRIPSRRLVQPAVSPPLTARRAFISDLFNSLRRREKDTKQPDPSQAAKQPKNPLLEEYLRNKPKAQSRPDMQRGDLSTSSIFAEPDTPETRQHQAQARVEAATKRDAAAMATALDPDPRARQRWERKMVMREVRQRGRVSRTKALRQTEREDLVKSQMMKTSTKKLGMLARQIAGKPIEEAITQMRFSKKKVARDVLTHLEYARDHAVVSRGMGLGEVEGTKGEPAEIELKDGKRKLVEDRTSIYVDQAWVGRGTYGKAYDIRARGRVNILRLPMTSISVVLKEEATRIRQSEERQKKRDNRKLWVQLPDRPITAQRQHVMW